MMHRYALIIIIVLLYKPNYVITRAQLSDMSGQFGTGVSYEHFGTSAEMSWVRSVLTP